MSKIEIIKDVEPCGKVWYLVRVDNWCQGAERTLEDAEKLAKQCEENIRSGLSVRTVISSKCIG